MAEQPGIGLPGGQLFGMTVAEVREGRVKDVGITCPRIRRAVGGHEIPDACVHQPRGGHGRQVSGVRPGACPVEPIAAQQGGCIGRPLGLVAEFGIKGRDGAGSAKRGDRRDPAMQEQTAIRIHQPPTVAQPERIEVARGVGLPCQQAAIRAKARVNAGLQQGRQTIQGPRRTGPPRPARGIGVRDQHRAG